MTTKEHAETAAGGRFAFGENWARFLDGLDDHRIAVAKASLASIPGLGSLAGRTFLDVGSGSGLFSLAARSLGARVRSFDFDATSVACTTELRQRYHPDDPDWIVERGSALDRAYLGTLGTFDVVYSWGVLHHTGAMREALANVAELVSPGGVLFISIYNDQGRMSSVWLRVKQTYNALPRRLRWLVLAPAAVRLWGPTMVRDLLAGRPFATWRSYARERGMSPWRDLVDWVGGLPFEVAKPEEIFEFYRRRGFVLERLTTCGGSLGCNEYVFVLPASVVDGDPGT